MKQKTKGAIRKANFKRAASSVNHIGILVGVIFAIVVANVVYTMATGIHLRSGSDILSYKMNSAIGTETIIANRGFIYDRSKDIIAQDVESYDLYAVIDPNIINAGTTQAYLSDFSDASVKLSPILGLSDVSILEGILNEGKKSKRFQVEFGKFGKNLSADQKKQIEALNLFGLGFIKSTTRVYPTDYFASQMIGFAQYNEENKKITGVMGVEKIFDTELSGKDGLLTYQKDAQGNYLPNTKTYESIATNGNDVYLTVDKNVQLTLEKALQDTMKQEGSDTQAAWGIVMEKKTGKILAQAGYPSFNLNTRDDITNYLNIPSERTFEVGSVMKAFVYAAAMNEGVYKGNDTFMSGTAKVTLDANGVAVRDDSTLNPINITNDAHAGGWGVITFDEGLVRSANTGIISLLTGYLNPDTNIDYLKKFGFFSPVGIKGLNEVNGMVNTERPGDKITVGYGQAATVNSYQIVQAASAIFGDGTMIKPYVVDKIVDPNTDKVLYQGKTEVVSNPITAKSAAQVQGLMRRVVEEDYGTAHLYQLSDITMMAKTGTGQIAIDGAYSTKYYTSSILAAAPADNPEIIIYYAFEGSEIRYYNRDFFKDIVRESLYALNTYNEASVQVPGTGSINGGDYREYTMPSLNNHSLDYANKKLVDMDVNKIIIGDGKNVVEQFPSEQTKVVTNQHIFILTDGNRKIMPDMSSWTRKDVMIFADLVHLKVIYKGSGQVSSQSIASGSEIIENATLVVELK